MGQAKQFRHHRLPNTAFPYIASASINPISDTPYLGQGSNILTSWKGYLERRPGFATHTTDDYTTNTIRRFFTWQRWGGAYFVMLNVITATQSIVYKQQVGTDTTFQSLFTSSATGIFDFVVANNHVFYGNGTDMRKYDGTNERAWGISMTAAAPTAANAGAGNVPAVIGHRYVFCYENTTTAHLSDISPQSAAIATASRQWTVTGARSTDAQVNQVRIYRTEDGGSIFFELSGSPIANPGAGTWSITDNDADASLSSTQAPLAGINDPPTASYGPVFFAGRIWTFANDTVYFSGLEEVTNGVPEESFGTPSAGTNQFTFGREVIGLAPVGLVLLVFTPNEIFRIIGDSLSTLRRDTLASRAGLRNRATISHITMPDGGDLAGWLDSSNIYRVTDGASIREISQSIRSDISAINHTEAAATFWDDGANHWTVLMDGGGTSLRVYDWDTRQWMPPWSISTPQAIGSGETAAGTYRLFLGRTSGGATKPLRLTVSTYQDDGANYTAQATLNLLPVGNEERPMELGALEYVGIERNSVALSDVGILVDEDPSGATFTSIFGNEAAPANRTNGTNLVEFWYYNRSVVAPGRRFAIRLNWAAANSNFRLYSMTAAYEVLR